MESTVVVDPTEDVPQDLENSEQNDAEDTPVNGESDPVPSDETKVNGDDIEEKDLAGSPLNSPGEIEHMTVVDEDVELVSSADEEVKKDSSEATESKKRRSSKRKNAETSESSSKKKRNDADDSKNESISDSKKESSSDSKKKSKSKDSTDPKEKELHKTLPLLEKYWKAVKDDPTDFTGWTYLLQYVDQANNVSAACEVYNDFLSRYPYCYGYWRKYADYLKKNGERTKCEETFEKGVQAIPLSVDLWIHYLGYAKDAFAKDDERIRALFEKSLSACGLEFRSDRLWDAYVKWESDGGRLLNVTSIFDRWLKVPTQGYVTVMEKFKDHVKKNSPQKIIDAEEFFNLRNEVLNEIKASKAELESKISDDAPPGEEAPDNLDKMNEEETKALKEKIINSRKERHKSTQKEALARWSFEENIKRPYFHVKPLEQCQLNNWKEYLEFEIKEGKQDRISLLFERCLIACALYEEFWIKFTDHLQDQPEVDVEKVRQVFTRACTIHHSKKLNIHLKWATFEELYGDSMRAASILESLEKSCPNVLVLIVRRINLFRRRGEFDQVCSLYEHYIESLAEKKELCSSLAIKYARFCNKIMNNIPKAVEILQKAMEKDKNNLRLITQLVDIYMCKNPIDPSEVVKVMDEAISTFEEVNDRKVLFAQRKLEFLEEFSDDCALIQKAQDVYDEMIKAIIEEKRKALEEKDGEKPKLKCEKKAEIKREKKVDVKWFFTCAKGHRHFVKDDVQQTYFIDPKIHRRKAVIGKIEPGKSVGPSDIDLVEDTEDKYVRVLVDDSRCPDTYDTSEFTSTIPSTKKEESEENESVNKENTPSFPSQEKIGSEPSSRVKKSPAKKTVSDTPSDISPESISDIPVPPEPKLYDPFSDNEESDQEIDGTEPKSKLGLKGNPINVDGNSDAKRKPKRADEIIPPPPPPLTNKTNTPLAHKTNTPMAQESKLPQMPQAQQKAQIPAQSQKLHGSQSTPSSQEQKKLPQTPPLQQKTQTSQKPSIPPQPQTPLIPPKAPTLQRPPMMYKAQTPSNPTPQTWQRPQMPQTQVPQQSPIPPKTQVPPTTNIQQKSSKPQTPSNPTPQTWQRPQMPQTQVPQQSSIPPKTQVPPTTNIQQKLSMQNKPPEVAQKIPVLQRPQKPPVVTPPKTPLPKVTSTAGPSLPQTSSTTVPPIPVTTPNVPSNQNEGKQETRFQKFPKKDDVSIPLAAPGTSAKSLKIQRRQKTPLRDLRKKTRWDNDNIEPKGRMHFGKRGRFSGPSPAQIQRREERRSRTPSPFHEGYHFANLDPHYESRLSPPSTSHSFGDDRWVPLTPMFTDETRMGKFDSDEAHFVLPAIRMNALVNRGRDRIITAIIDMTQEVSFITQQFYYKHKMCIESLRQLNCEREVDVVWRHDRKFNCNSEVLILAALPCIEKRAMPRMRINAAILEYDQFEGLEDIIIIGRNIWDSLEPRYCERTDCILLQNVDDTESSVVVAVHRWHEVISRIQRDWGTPMATETANEGLYDREGENCYRAKSYPMVPRSLKYQHLTACDIIAATVAQKFW